MVGASEDVCAALAAVTAERAELQAQLYAKDCLVRRLQEQLRGVKGEAPALQYELSHSVLVDTAAGSSLVPLQQMRAKCSNGRRGSHAAVHRGPLSGHSALSLGRTTSELLENDDPVMTAELVVDMITKDWEEFRDPAFAVMQDNDVFFNLVMDLCANVRSVLLTDDMHLQLTSPMFVLGDIHGQFKDLHHLMSRLTNFNQLKFTSAKFLFLGDYVDRGQGSVQVAAYLLALKYLHPNSVFLLRGNHEDRNVNDGYGFLDGCIRSFGDIDGRRLFTAVNDAFDCLPLCATVDNAIFCVHGGIPRTDRGPHYQLEGLATLQRPLYIPHMMPSAPCAPSLAMAYELMWNDPAWSEEGLDASGFGPNPRGYGTCRFGQKAIDDFLQSRGLQFIIRAHEAKDQGLRVCKQAKVITIFTAANYGGTETNSAGAVYIADGHLRLISVSHGNVYGSMSHQA